MLFNVHSIKILLNLYEFNEYNNYIALSQLYICFTKRADLLAEFCQLFFRGNAQLSIFETRFRVAGMFILLTNLRKNFL